MEKETKMYSQDDNGKSESMPLSYEAKIALNLMKTVKMKVELNFLTSQPIKERNPFREEILSKDIDFLLSLNTLYFILAEY